MTGSSPISVQAKGEPAAIVPATIQTPKAIIPTEIRYETTVSMASGLNPTPAARAAMVQRAMRYGCHLRSAGKIGGRFGSRPSAKAVQAARGVDRVRWAAKRMRTC